eukprot:15326335-Ditylum_brightwellii.AAC.1
MPIANIETAKLLFNSVITTPQAKFMSIDIKDFYLNTPMEGYKYIRFPINIIPNKIIEQYNLKVIVHNGHIFAKICKGVYRLPQAGHIAHDKLVKHLQQHGYTPCLFTPGLWRYKSRDITFCLVVDDFGVKYTQKEDAEHLIYALQQIYTIITVWDEKCSRSVSLKWNYTNQTAEKHDFK